jgi:hypothetical protein
MLEGRPVTEQSDTLLVWPFGNTRRSSPPRTIRASMGKAVRALPMRLRSARSDDAANRGILTISTKTSSCRSFSAAILEAPDEVKQRLARREVQTCGCQIDSDQSFGDAISNCVISVAFTFSL